MTDYQGLAVATPGWRRAVLLLGCGALLLLAALGAATWWAVRHFHGQPPAHPSGAGTP